MSHRPLHRNKTVVLWVYMITTWTCARADIERKKEYSEESVPPPQFAYINGVAILKSDVVRTKIARLPYCRDVTVGMSLPVSRHYHAACRMLEKDASFFNVLSIASLWDLRLWLQWGEGMWACARIEYIIVNVFSHRTYYNALFIVCFSKVSSPDEGSETHGPKQATSGSITGRPGAIRWRLTTRFSHLIVSETLCLLSTATLCRSSITCWCNCKCRPITGIIKYCLT